MGIEIHVLSGINIVLESIISLGLTNYTGVDCGCPSSHSVRTIYRGDVSDEDGVDEPSGCHMKLPAREDPEVPA